MTCSIPPPTPLLTSPFPSFPPFLCPQCFNRIMGLSWARRSAARPVSSPARQDRCKVGGEGKRDKCEGLVHVQTEDGEEMKRTGSFSLITDEWTHNVDTRCTLGETERFKIDGRGEEKGREGYRNRRENKKGEFKKRGKRGERASEVLSETKEFVRLA